ncbi:MAG: DUF2156 domain-containing protein [Ruminococcaceae bacterium]|nr:DUF2156 domain-containing protein [Oscillospiraceae bacterium]
MHTDTFEIKSVSISDKALFDRYFAAFEPLNSEYTFTNMFMWRKSYNIRYAVIDGMLCIFSRHGENGTESVNFPLGDGDVSAPLRKIFDYFDSIGQRPVIRLYKESDLLRLNVAFPDKFVITEDIDSFDYVYNTSDLIELPGSKYHSKRNHISKFKSLFNFEYRPLTPELVPECLEMFSRWCDSKKGIVPGISEQREAVVELMENYEVLGVTGGVITVLGKVVAFSFGEVLSQKNSMAVIHLEHADTEYHGSFPIMNQQFLEKEWIDFKYVNREEDMGLPGLRKAKQSYKPKMMTKKYIASLA